MIVTVQDIRSGRRIRMSKKFADILVKLKKATYEITESVPVHSPVYKTRMLTATNPSAKKPAKAKKPKKAKEKKQPAVKKIYPKEELPEAPPVALAGAGDVEKKEYLTRIMTAEEK